MRLVLFFLSITLAFSHASASVTLAKEFIGYYKAKETNTGCDAGTTFVVQLNEDKQELNVKVTKPNREVLEFNLNISQLSQYYLSKDKKRMKMIENRRAIAPVETYYNENEALEFFAITSYITFDKKGVGTDDGNAEIWRIAISADRKHLAFITETITFENGPQELVCLLQR